ncbi:MAG: hypothetical protein E2P02_30125 [Acidobacteria bacterium]|nr:MAG: hypothetical protein E2P02_30125 [Acidobacteriota bacterium]
MPLHKIEVEGGVLYISDRNGAVVLATTGRSRMAAWLGAIPHWLYLRALRSRRALWSQVVLGHPHSERSLVLSALP